MSAQQPQRKSWNAMLDGSDAALRKFGQLPEIMFFSTWSYGPLDGPDTHRSGPLVTASSFAKGRHRYLGNVFHFEPCRPGWIKCIKIKEFQANKWKIETAASKARDENTTPNSGLGIMLPPHHLH